MNFEQETDFFEHLNELRTRLIYAVLAIVIGMVVGWFVYPYAYAFTSLPIQQVLPQAHGQIVGQHPGEFFFAQMKYAGILGLILASPVILYQLWAFVRPGLTTQERKVVRPLVPAICLLFLAGAALAYYMLPAIMTFFLGFQPKDVGMLIPYQTSVTYPLTIMAGFGLAFEVPIVILGLVHLGILTPQILLKQWRIAIVVMAVVSAVVTPTPDPVNMSLMLAPLLVLYFGTVLLSFRITKSRERAEESAG